jgi:hypothetical protein
MDGTTILTIVVIVVLGLALSLPYYWALRKTERIPDPTTRDAVERMEEEVWRFRRNQPGGWVP